MFLSKSLLLLLIILLSPFNSKSQIDKAQITHWVIIKGGFLRIEGSTNINKFKCEIKGYSKAETIIVYRNPDKSSLPIKGELILDIQDFDCHNPVMTRDLRKILKAKAFPLLIVKFINLSRYPDLNGLPDLIKGAVTIELAGITKRFKVDYKFLSAGKDLVDLIGTRQLSFSDFNISPPKKAGGMIQTRDELSVIFNLQIKVIE